jgi:hypothetical protein
MVGPDEDGVASRSWIIYVLGGSYPETHPLLNTPSLFTDSPTYEDMVLLSSLLGPAKPPVASEADVASAPGLYTISVLGSSGSLIARPHDEEGESVPLGAGERCLVCLCDFEAMEEARKLVNCGHMFHRICIEQVGNPLCCWILLTIAVAHDGAELLPSLPKGGSPEEHGERRGAFRGGVPTR